LVFSCHVGLRSLTVVGLELGRRGVVQLRVQPLFVEPRDPRTGGRLEVVEALPGSAVGGQGGRVAVQLGLEEPDDRLGHCIVVAVADGADRGGGADVVDPLGVGDGRVLSGLNRSWQHRLVGSTIGDR